MSRYLTLFLQHRARLVCGWVTMTNRGLSHMHAWFLRETWKYRDGWHCSMKEPMNFVKWDSDLESTLQGHGRLNILCFWTSHNVIWHDGTPHVGAALAHGTTSVQYFHYHSSLISFLKIQYPTISHTKSTTSPNRFRNHNVAGALPYVPILGTSGSLANLQPTAKKQPISSIGP